MTLVLNLQRREVAIDSGPEFALTTQSCDQNSCNELL